MDKLRGIMSDKDMGRDNKKCNMCKTIKPVANFHKNKANKDGLDGRCKDCYSAYKKMRFAISDKEAGKKKRMEYLKIHPWISTYNRIQHRCKNVGSYKGRKNLLTSKQLKEMWFRDKAYLMEKPSIDRKNNKYGYNFDNCEFIEMRVNCSKDNFGNKNGVGKRGKYGKRLLFA